MALNLGDRHSELLSRIGIGVVARFVGNLPESEQALRAVIAEASAIDDKDAEARACHDLAGTLHFAGRAADAVPMAFRAYELYESPLQQAKALSDTGAILKELGHYAGAKDALELVLAHELPTDHRARAELECLDLAALMGDRLAFERFRQVLAAQQESLLPEVRLDFELKLGVGLSQFEEYQHGQVHLQRAIELAEEYGMAERLFYAEQQLKEAQQTRGRPSHTTTCAQADADDFPPLQETVARLEFLVVGQRD
jgi:tetratricopeptide (TPR) repeat protein